MSQQDEQLQLRNLPADSEEAINLLAYQVNVLHGRVAALMTYIKALGIDVNVPDEELIAKATSRLPPVYLPARGPSTYTNHAHIALAEMLSTD